MTVPFDPSLGAISVEALLVGSIAHVQLRLILDTGATSTLISEDRLLAAGCDPTQPIGSAHVTFGSGAQSIPIVNVPVLSALGKSRVAYPVLSHTLPVSAGVDGVLGLDFFEGCVLTLDFVNSTVTLD